MSETAAIETVEAGPSGRRLMMKGDTMASEMHDHAEAEEPAQHGHSRRKRRWRFPAVNMSLAERVVRVLAGLLLAVAGAWVIVDRVQGAGAVLVWSLLTLGVADLVLSGLVGYCPLYRYVRAPGTRRGSP